MTVAPISYSRLGHHREPNVVDRLKGLTHDAIMADLDKKRYPFSILLCNIQYELNYGNIIRSHAGMLGSNIYMYGDKRFDRRGAVGQHHYSHIYHVPTPDDLDDVFKQYDHVYGVDIMPGAKLLNDTKFNFDGKTLFCFGSEADGMDIELISRIDKFIYLQMEGSLRSFNLGGTAQVVMWEFLRQLKESKK